MKVKKHFLFCPGPVNIAANVKEAVQNEIGHREKEFSQLLRSVNSKLLKLYEVKNAKDFHPVIVTGSGTAVNEAVLSSLPGNLHILILSNGEFGERLYNISKIHNKNTKILEFGWAEKIDLEKLKQYLHKNQVDVIVMVHHETSTGMLNPIEKVGTMAKRHKQLFIVDSISSVGAEKIDLEKSNIAFCTGTASKAIGSLPGVAFVVGKRKEFEKLKDIPAKTAYLNLYNFYSYSTRLAQTPNTPAVQLFFSLNQALTNILKEGVAKRRKHIDDITQILRIGIKNMGLSFLLDEKNMSSVLTTIKLPNSVEFEKLKSCLRERNIIVYNGKGPLLNKVFQVGNIGSINKDNVEFFLKNLHEVLEQLTTDRNTKIVRKIRSNIHIQESQLFGAL